MVSCPTCGHRHGDDVRRCPSDGTALEGASDPLVGRMIAGRYRLVQQIGVGGMSTVYLARHVVIERLSAIKVLRTELAGSEVHRERFLREARAVARINHEHIVEITDYGETVDGLVYLVMEYIRGEALSSLLVHGPVRPLRAVGIVEQVARALARAHQMGIVHRDIKPENILLVPGTSRPDFVKVMDFGVAKIGGLDTLSSPNHLVGTAGYMAPEYLAGREIDGRADLYALGVVLYEMVTSHLPFEIERPSDLLRDRTADHLIPPTRFEPTLPGRLEAVILRALAPDPDERHRDAYHFLMDLTAAAAEIPGATVAPWRWGVPASGAGTRTLVDVPAFQIAPTIAAAPVSVAPPSELESVLDAVTQGSSDGVLAASFWRFRRDAVYSLLEEVHSAGAFPLEIQEARERLDAGLLELGACEEVGRGLLEQIGSVETQARDFRQQLGRAIDVVGHDMSSTRGELGKLAARRKELQERRDLVQARDRAGRPSAPEGTVDALVWEFAAVDERLTRVAADTDDLEYQLSELRAQLSRHNEKAERELELLRAQLEDESRRSSDRSEAMQGSFGEILAHLARRPGAVEKLRALVGTRSGPVSREEKTEGVLP